MQRTWMGWQTVFPPDAVIGSSLALIAMLMLPAAARSGTPVPPEARLFDPPARVQTVPAKRGSDTGRVKCTYYPDLMIRESNTDSPDPAPAAIVRDPAKSKPDSCNAGRRGSSIGLATQGFYLLGRKGPFLFFEAADPLGAADFKIVGAENGRVLYADAKFGGGLQSVVVQNDVLQVRYTRGINGSCSLVSGGDSCWRVIAQDAKIPPSVAKPAADACTAAYRSGKAPGDNPSIVFYDVSAALRLSGESDISSGSPSRCAPLP